MARSFTVIRRFLPLLLLLRLIAFGQGAPSAQAMDYVLQPSDLLRVQVFQEPDLLRDVRITQENAITLPLIGRVDLRNKTVRQAEQLIRDLYDRDFLVNPQVSLSVIEYSKRTVNVLGMVNSPGAIVFPQEQRMTLLDAVTRAGGFTRLADRKRVKLTRTLPDGKAENFVINADQLLKGGSKGLAAHAKRRDFRS